MVDFSPIANIRPVNLAEIYGAADQANIQGMQKQALALQLQKAQQEDADNKSFKDYLTTNRNPTSKDLIAKGYLKQGMELGKYENEQTKANNDNLSTTATTNKTNLEVAHNRMKYLGDAFGTLAQDPMPTPDKAHFVIDSLSRNGVLDAKTAQDWHNQVPQDPTQIKQLATQLFQQTLDAKDQLPKLGMTDAGGKIIPTSQNVLTGAVTQGDGVINKTATPDAIMTDARAREEGAANRNVTIRGQNMVDSRDREKVAAMQDPASIESVAQMIANGQMPPLTGFAARSPAALKIMQRVSEINPNYSAIDYGTAKKASGDFATGKNGNTVRSLNVAVTHLDSLQNLANALNNGDVQAFNKIGNMYAQQTGSAAPTNFDTAKKLVADEVVKAVVGSGGGVADREEAAKVIQNANSPAQLAGAINTYKDLMRGQLNGFRQQYEQTTGKKDFDKYISANAKAELADKPATSLSVQAPNGKTYTFKTEAQLKEFKRQAGL